MRSSSFRPPTTDQFQTAKWGLTGIILFGIVTAKKDGKMATVDRFLKPPDGSFFLFGPRGTGKSTWLKQSYPDAVFLDMLDPVTYRTYTSRPETLEDLARGNPNRPHIVVDEVQKAPAVLDVVHRVMENMPDRRFVLTGSSSRKLKRTGADMLAGRAAVRSMHPFLAAEVGDQFDLQTALRLGMLPVVWSARNPVESLAAYVTLYLREEVQMEGIVRNTGNFSRFLEVMSFSHGAVLNTSAVSRECQVSRKTVEGYVQILEDLLLGCRVPVFSIRAKRLLTQHAKFYYFDAGLFRSLRLTGALDKASEADGLALEGLVFQHLRAWIAYGHSDVNLYFWRTRAGREVDFVLYGPDLLCAIEVKNTAHLASRDLHGLQAFKEDFPEAKTCILFQGQHRLVTAGIPCMPVGEFLRQLHPHRELPS